MQKNINIKNVKEYLKVNICKKNYTVTSNRMLTKKQTNKTKKKYSKITNAEKCV